MDYLYRVSILTTTQNGTETTPYYFKDSITAISFARGFAIALSEIGDAAYNNNLGNLAIKDTTFFSGLFDLCEDNIATLSFGVENENIEQHVVSSESFRIREETEKEIEFAIAIEQIPIYD